MTNTPTHNTDVKSAATEQVIQALTDSASANVVSFLNQLKAVKDNVLHIEKQISDVQEQLAKDIEAYKAL